MDSWLFILSYVLLWVLVIFLSLVLVGVVRQHSLLLSRLQGQSAPTENGPTLLPSGTPAPYFQTREVHSGKVFKSKMLVGEASLLVFIAPYCSACESILADLEPLRKRVNARLIVLINGPALEARRFANQHLPQSQVLFDQDGTIARDYLVTTTPTAVLLASDGTIMRYGFHSDDPRSGSPFSHIKRLVLVPGEALQQAGEPRPVSSQPERLGNS